MRKGTVSLDFLLSIIVMLLVANTLFTASFIHIENSAATSVKYKAEAISMGMGSAINHFRAINPSPGDELQIGVKEFYITASRPIVPDSPGNWPPVPLNFKACTATVNTTTNILMINITYHHIDSNFEESAIARYPLVAVGGDTISKDCTDTFKFNGNMEVS